MRKIEVKRKRGKKQDYGGGKGKGHTQVDCEVISVIIEVLSSFICFVSCFSKDASLQEDVKMREG